MEYEKTYTTRHQYRRMGLVTIKQRKTSETGLYGLVWAIIVAGMLVLPALLNLG